MFSILILLALTTQAPAGAPTPPRDVEVHYDKFENNTFIHVNPIKYPLTDDRGGDLYVTLMATHTGKGRPTELSNDVCLIITRIGREWEYLTDHKMSIVCGDLRLLHPGDKYTSELKHGDCWETIQTFLSRIVDPQRWTTQATCIC